MESFYTFWDKINGKPYKDVQPPVKYNMPNYLDLDSDKMNGSEDGTWALKPLSQEDMSTTSSEDVLDWQAKYGTNTTKLGKEMTDDEFKKFHGHTW
jgi:hypothetical protein